MAFDTGSVYNFIRLRELPQDWENYRIPDASVPALGDANGNRLRFLDQVVQSVRFGSTMYRVSFLVVERLVVSVIIGTAFMNRHVRGIMCIDREIKLTRATIPILSRHRGWKQYVNAKSPSTETPDGPPVRQDADNINHPQTVKLVKIVTIPPMSQVAVPVRTNASGLVFLKPKHSVLVRHNVRTANRVAEVKGNRPFKIAVSNFSEQPRMLHKGMNIGYATRNPKGVYRLNDEISRTYEAVLNLPFVRKDNSPRRVDERDVESLPETKPDVWQKSVDLSHVDDESIRGEILSMLSKHRDMWRPGHLGEITATEHRIVLAPGTHPYVRRRTAEVIEAAMYEPKISQDARGRGYRTRNLRMGKPRSARAQEGRFAPLLYRLQTS